MNNSSVTSVRVKTCSIQKCHYVVKTKKKKIIKRRTYFAPWIGHRYRSVCRIEGNLNYVCTQHKTSPSEEVSVVYFRLLQKVKQKSIEIKITMKSLIAVNIPGFQQILCQQQQKSKTVRVDVTTRS